MGRREIETHKKNQDRYGRQGDRRGNNFLPDQVGGTEESNTEAEKEQQEWDEWKELGEELTTLGLTDEECPSGERSTRGKFIRQGDKGVETKSAGTQPEKRTQ